MAKQISDREARNTALDSKRSFIVQAPAGSGKTELLIQRYLVLLSRVRNPEEIIAITFTRKAAAEMRIRILSALHRGVSDIPPPTDHERKTWELAREALAQERRCGWNISENPARLRIQTIDSLCSALTRQMPILSGFGTQPEIVEDASGLYALAASETVAELESGSIWSDSIEALVRHMDNHLEKVENLIAEMLPRRDQWLRHIIDTPDARLQRKNLEDAMCAVIASALETARSLMPEPILAQLPEHARFAAENLFESHPGSPVCSCLGIESIPDCIPEEFPVWQGLTELLLTRGGTLRKGVDKRLGFPAAPAGTNDIRLTAADLKERKTRFKALLASLEDDTELIEALCTIRQLPAPYYTESQWDLLEALFEILKLAVAHLRLVFREQNRVDFTEIALCAVTALGDAENPTDLALSLDYRISHILIDEFQDTSISQFELLGLLTAGWTPGDGRTFFAVGDPMQSIYSFREAEVGLFLQARQSGLHPQLPLTPLVLSANFRSSENIVGWINSSFERVLPGFADMATGAVPYTASEAVMPAAPGMGVHIHPVAGEDDQQAAQTVLGCIGSVRQVNPEAKIAILVRSRSHLREIIPLLRAENIRYQAVEIDSLAQRPVISDLICLTRALSHPADRIAWLSVLRAPWCGLTLADLFVLAGDDHLSSIQELMKEPERLAKMSPEGRIRISRISEAVYEAMVNRGRLSLRRQVESVWTQIGGPAAVDNAADLEDAAVYFDFLEREVGYDMPTDFKILEKAAGLFARPDPDADESLQIMTIHKAKGLEFDAVILPGLEKAPPPEQQRLLLWQELPDADPDNGLILAPITETGTVEDPTYQYIRSLHAKKTGHENGRLLYVAATRAKHSLHIIGRANISRTGEIETPDRRSLLFSLWPAVRDEFLEASTISSPAEKEDSESLSSDLRRPHIRRLSASWRPPEPPTGLRVESCESGMEEAFTTDSIQFDWAGQTVRHMGTVVHRWLRHICETGVNNWDAEQIALARQMICSDLLLAGTGKEDLEKSADQVISALGLTLADPRGRWILSAHDGGRCEYGITGRIDGQIINAILDRTFIDEKNTRWIIDYKSGDHKGGDMDGFLEMEKARYRQQMDRYASLMHRIDPDRPIMRALYFPRFSGWCQWSE